MATPHRPATDAAVAAFEDGGNAVDAALAAAAVLTVSYPHNCGLGAISSPSSAGRTVRPSA